MPVTRTRALVDSAFMAALMVVITALGTLLALPLPFLLPLPVALAVLRHSSRHGIMAGAAATGLTLMAFGPLTAIAMPLLSGLLPGLALGAGLARHRSPSRTATLVGGTVLVGTLAGLGLSLVVMGQNPLDLMAQMLKEFTDQYVKMAQSLAPNPNSQQEQMIEGMKALTADPHRTILMILPSSLILGSAVSALATYQMAVWLFPRFGHTVPRLPPLSRWSFPRWVLWAYALVVVAQILQRWEDPAALAFTTAQRTLELLLTTQGFLAVTWFIQRYWQSRAVPWVVVASPFLLGPVAMLILFFAGVLDLGTDFRHRDRGPAAPTAD